MGDESVETHYLIEEYKHLGAGLSELGGEARALARYAVLSTSGIWTWLATFARDYPHVSFLK